MIEWIEYDSTSREIESHIDHLITDGLNVWVAQHAKYIGESGYGWHKNRDQFIVPVTHWAKLNFPFKEE